MSDLCLRPDNAYGGLSRRLQKADIDIGACYQCGRCSAGCPVSPFFDLLPMQVVRLSAYGAEQELLSCRTIWLCASCETCSTRCPNGIDIARLMDTLRQLAIYRGVKPAEKRVAAFHRSFLRSVRRWGRTYEIGMLAAFKTRSGDLLSDLGLGWNMFKRGKLRLLPHAIRDRRQVKAIFRKSGKEREE